MLNLFWTINDTQKLCRLYIKNIRYFKKSKSISLLSLPPHKILAIPDC